MKTILHLECEVDVSGLAARLHISDEQVCAILHKNALAFSAQMAKNPRFFKVFGEIDMRDLTEPLVFSQYVEGQFSQLLTLIKKMSIDTSKLTTDVATLTGLVTALTKALATAQSASNDLKQVQSDDAAIQAVIDSTTASIDGAISEANTALGNASTAPSGDATSSASNQASGS